MPRKTKFTTKEIVTAAFELVREDGWGGLSSAAVADRIGSSTMPIYSHFKNLEELEHAVLEKCWDLLMEYESRVITGDVWFDQAIGYVFFARDERQLFRCMNDPRHLEKQRELRMKNWEFLGGPLKDYAPFAGVNKEVLDQVRFGRVMMTQGLASMISIEWNPELESDENIIKYISRCSKALLEGLPKLSDP